MIKSHQRTKPNSFRALILVFSILHSTSPREAPKFCEQGRSKVDSTKEYTGWQAIFFREINRRAKLASLGSLRDANIGANGVELRVWIGFGPVGLEGFVIKKCASEWSATYLRSISPSLARNNYQKVLGSPQSGWDTFWERLVANDVQTLPGTQRTGWVDGESFVVEIATAGAYKTYMYDNPQLTKDPAGLKMLEIVRIIREEFDIPN